MTRSNTEIRFIQSQTGFGPMPHGNFAGEPTVSLKLSSSDNKSMKVNSLESMFENNGWKQKLSSGYARLRIYGDNPLHDRHADSLEYLIDVLDARFIDIEVDEKYINERPSRYISRKADTYSFIIDTTRDEKKYDHETMEYISDIASNGSGQYFMKADSVTCEDYVKNFSWDYNVYDSDIWLYPKGKKRSSIDESREKIEKVAKRNTWNLSPRMDIRE